MDCDPDYKPSSDDFESSDEEDCDETKIRILLEKILRSQNEISKRLMSVESQTSHRAQYLKKDPEICSIGKSHFLCLFLCIILMLILLYESLK